MGGVAHNKIGFWFSILCYGNLNIVPCDGERKGSSFEKGKAEDINNFINLSELQDLSSLGRKKFSGCSRW